MEYAGSGYNNSQFYSHNNDYNVINEVKDKLAICAGNKKIMKNNQDDLKKWTEENF